jgi:soluble lytic murein transglycosylase-like protein
MRAPSVAGFSAIAVIAAAAVPASAGTFWSRERSDGVVEFTNKAPAGGRWKVLFKTGPGKAAALRGATDIVPARDTSPARYSRYDQDIRDGQAFFGIPEPFLRAVIKTESDYDPRVVSSAGAQGLMQLLPETARQMGVTDNFDPRQNIMGGARYLQVLARRFCRTPAAANVGAGAGAGGARGVEQLTVCSPDEKVKVVAAYHAGPGAVEKYGGMPPYETTRAYVGMVLRRYEQYRLSAAGDAGP